MIRITDQFIENCFKYPNNNALFINEKYFTYSELLNLTYSDVFIHGIAAIQELSKLNDEKDKKIAELEERLSRLEKLLLNGIN